MKHSIGPWHEGQGNGEGFVFAEEGRMRLEKGGITTLYPICKVITGYNQEEDEANAALIAAAPELLEALALLVEPCPPDFAIEWAKEIIKKAKGE